MTIRRVSALVTTTLVCATAALLGHLIAGLGWYLKWRWPWQATVGASLAVVSVVAFGGFYIASRRTRVAIASAFLLTFLVMLTFILTMGAFANQAATGVAKELLDDFRQLVSIVIAFYFVAEGAVGVSKVVSASKLSDATLEQIQQSDRDLVDPAPPS